MPHSHLRETQNFEHTRLAAEEASCTRLAQADPDPVSFQPSQPFFLKPPRIVCRSRRPMPWRGLPPVFGSYRSSTAVLCCFGPSCQACERFFRFLGPWDVGWPGCRGGAHTIMKKLCGRISRGTQKSGDWSAHSPQLVHGPADRDMT